MIGRWTHAPLRWLIRKAARSQGFLDPIEVLGRLRGLAQPSEVGEPIELLRAGVVFHARGLINSKVIQHNLDWVWPYWVERQYDPHDDSFLPRAFSVTHVNLTHRNWTAIGVPDHSELPIVDPRGLLTPFLDGWSLDAWLLDDDGTALYPSRADSARQDYHPGPAPSVTTASERDGLHLDTHARVRDDNGEVYCEFRVRARRTKPGSGRLVVSVRPQNPEGISFVRSVELLEHGDRWRIDGRHDATLVPAPDAHYAANYRQGDVLFEVQAEREGARSECAAGLASAAAVYRFDEEREVSVRIPLSREPGADAALAPVHEWDGRCRLECPEPRYRFLFDAAITSLVLHSPGDIYPGPYTYKRFWFRDAAFIAHAMICAGFPDRARRAIDAFFDRQTRFGYFRSQDGEWDSNGEVLWLLESYLRLTGQPMPEAWYVPVERAARWIERKCLPDTPESAHAGLLPAGFSAEHFGPNDYYYWDDFWGVAGLRAAARLLGPMDAGARDHFRARADHLSQAIEHSLDHARERLQRPAMPAAPYRRLDAGAVGSLAVGYPLALFEADDPRLMATAEYLLEHCCVDGAFFQDMVHSGSNAYLTLHLAQVFLRAGDERYLGLMDRVAELASPTGQWPEAIHPRTRGGCMGDGHHVWAAAEWVLMLRHCFLREAEGELVLCPGIPERWLDAGEPIAFGPTTTVFGPVTIRLEPAGAERWSLAVEGQWHTTAPALRCALPGFREVSWEGERGFLERLS